MAAEVVLVTGALGGLGTAIVREALRSGYRVVACDRVENRAWEPSITEAGHDQLIVHRLDVTKEDEVVALAETLKGAGIKLYALVNNAGVAATREVWDIESRRWDLAFSVNLDGAMYLTRAFCRGMISRRSGRVINVTSVAAYAPHAVGGMNATYAASKAGLSGLTRAVAVDLAPYGITVNAVAPGIVVHEGIRDFQTPEHVAEVLGRVPLGRSGTPEEIAATVGFLLSKPAAYITGQTIHVNGGLYMPG